MAIKVYKGGSWVNTTGVSAIGKADTLSIGQTNTSLATSDKNYYLSFVDANHPHTSRQYEDFYTGIGITFSPITNAIGVGGDIYSNGSLYLNGTSTNDNGDINSNGGSDGNFEIFNQGAGSLVLSVKNSSNAQIVGIVSFSSESGTDFADRQSIFQSNINPKVTDTYDIGKSATERWNNVYANCFIGNGTGLTGTGFWEPDTKENLKAGTDAGSSINNHTCYNIFIGYEAGKNTASTAGGEADDGIADENIFIGRCSGHTNTTGGYNVFGGSHSGFCNTSGGCNVAFGNQAGYCNDTGSCNVFLGFCAGRSTLTGNDNIIMGYQAGFCNRVHSNNIFLGKYSGIRITGQDNIALGYSSLLGGASGENANTGQGNIAIGCATGKLLNDGNHSYNVFLGSFAGQTQRKGSYNVVIGASAEVADVNEGCQLVIGGTSGDAVNWLTGTGDGDIKPFRGIIDCSNSTGSTTETQVLTSTGTNIQWATNVAQAINADKVGIGTTTNEGGDDVQDYYVPFVRDNNPHGGREYEQLYSGKLVYRYQASDDSSRVGINTDNVGQELNVYSKEFSGIRVKSARIASAPLDTMTQIGGLQFSDNVNTTGFTNGRTMSAIVGTVGGDLILKTGHDATDNGSIDRVTITPLGHFGIGTTNPIADDIATSLDTNNKVLAVGIVTAKEYYGRFKGTIDPDASITLDKIEEGDTSAEVVDGGSNGHFFVKTEGDERLRIDKDGRLLINNSNNLAPANFDSLLQVNSANHTGSIVIGRHSDDAKGPVLLFQKSRSGTSTPGNAVLSDGDLLGAIRFYGSDGTDGNSFAGNISCEVDGTPASNDMPGRLVFSTTPAGESESTERLRIGSSGQIGVYDSTTTKADSYGTDNQVLTSKGGSAAAVWQDLGGIPASEANQLKITKTNSKGTLYLLGVENASSGENTADGNETVKTVYQKTQNTLFFDTISDTLRVPKIRGELVAGGSWPAIQGNLTIQTNHLIPSSTVALTNNVITGGQNLGSETKKWATVYAQEFDGALGGTADKAKQLEVQKNESSGTGHYFGMITGVGENGSPSNQTFYTDTALTYNPSSDILTALNINVTTKLDVKGNTVLGDSATADTITFTGKVNSAVLPKTNAADKDDTNGLDLGGSGSYWRTIYAREFKGSVVGDATSAQTLDIGTDDNTTDRYLTFVAASGDGKEVYMDSELKYNSNTDTLTPVNLIVTKNTTLGDSAAEDTTTFNSKVISHITPGGTITNNVSAFNLGETGARWHTVYAENFSGSFTGSIEKITTTKSEDKDKTYLTFTDTAPDDTNRDSFLLTNPHLYFRSDSSSTGEKLTVDCQLDVTGDATFSEDVTLGHSATEDIVTFNSKVASHIFPSHSATAANDTSGKDLGDGSNYWRKVYARDYAGTFTGTITSRNIAMTGDVHWNVDFDAGADESAVGTIQPAAVEESMINISNDPANGYFLQTNASGTLTWAQVSAGDGVSLAFTDLTDVPNAYTDSGSKLVAVKDGADGLEFVSASNVGTDTFVTGASFVSITGGKQLQLTRNNSQTTLLANLTLSDLGGVNKFLDLTDVTPTTYDGQAHKFVRVNKPNASGPNENNGSGLEFIDATGFNSDFSFIGLSDTPNAYAAGAADQNKYVRVNSAGDKLIFDSATISAGTVDLGKTGDTNHNDWHFIFADSRDGGSETLYVNNDANPALIYKDSTSTLQTVNLSVAGSTTLGDANTDTVTWNARSGTILPSGTTGTQDLGSSTYKWGTVYANTIAGSLTVDTDNTTVLYTKTVSGNKVAAGTGEFTFTETTSRNTLKVTHTDAAASGGVVRASSKDDANFVEISCDGGIEICRTISNTGGYGGAFVDWKDDADDYDARIQLTTNVASNPSEPTKNWNADNDKGGLLFETGGEGHRHMLLTKNGILGITTGTDENAIKANNGTDSWRYGFVPGISRDANLNDAHNINNRVVLDVNGTLMLRSNEAFPNTATSTRVEGAQITFNNSEDTVAYSVDVYGTTANNSTLRIIDEKEPIGNRGTQRFAMNRSGAITFKTFSGGTTGASNADVDYGVLNDVLISQGVGDIPIWKSLSALGASGATTEVTYIDSHSKTGSLSSNTGGGSQSITFDTNICGLIVICVGAGGGGGGAYSNTYSEGGGGGAGGMNLRSYTTAEINMFKDNGAYCEIGASGAGGPVSGNNPQDGSNGGATFFRPKCANGQIPGIVGNSCASTGETDILYSLQIHTGGGGPGTKGSSNVGGNGGLGGISYEWADIALRGNSGQNGESHKIRGFGDDQIVWGRSKPLGGITPFGVQFSPVAGYPNRGGWGKGGDGGYATQPGMSGESGGSGAIIIIEILK